MEIYCKICNKKVQSLTGLASHINQTHSINSKEYYIKYLKTETEGICPVCGKDTVWLSLGKGYRIHCSKSCSTKDPIVFKLKCETELKNTGYKTTMEDPIHHQKMIELSKLQENQEKRIASCKANNNEGTGFQIKHVKETAQKTILDKYGVDNVFKLDDVQNKIKQSLVNKYGVNNAFKLEEFRNKAVNTYYNKTGYRYPLMNPEIKSKIRNKYIYNDISFDSSWELAYYIWLVDNNINFQYQPNIPLKYFKDNKEHYYYPDFKINNIFYEIKGNQFFNENDELINPFNNELNLEKYQCMLDNNVKILREKDIKPILEYINNNYGKNYLKQFKINNLYLD